MPAVTVADVLALPRIPAVPVSSRSRGVEQVVAALTTFEGEGFQVRRAFPSPSLRGADPFILLDHLGAVEYAPGEAKGAPDHPHRGFETVTYIIDGAVEHRDSTGGGGLISDGATQWMTAGAGIVHSEMPPEYLVRSGGLFHGVQLWVNLPRAAKWAKPRYQDIGAADLGLATTPDGGALVRVIAGSIPALAGARDGAEDGGSAETDELRGPGSTQTPIAYAHVTLEPGAELSVPWPAEFTALAYVLAGHGTVGPEVTAVQDGRLAVFAPSGDHITVRAGLRQPVATPTMEVLLLGGRPIREPVVQYGPFVMNTREEIIDAIEDYRAGRMGAIPPITAG